jgi:Na+/melibiose symporter-like transporter
MKNRKELLSRIAYASGDIYGGGAFIIVGLLLLVYLTNVEGFSGTSAGIIVFIGKAWDAITDPLWGNCLTEPDPVLVVAAFISFWAAFLFSSPG